MASFAVDVEDENYNENKVKDELQFQDIPHSDEAGKSQTHTFTNFPHSAESDDEAGDKTEFLKDEKKAPSFWTFEYYQQFFNVDTRQVMHRVLGSMMPLPGRNYLTTHIRPNPDLYGPFWICTTLVFTTAIAGNLANYMQSAGTGYTWKYDFHKVTFAATAIFSYWWLVPAALFSVLWWRGSQSRYTFLELISVYGYSLAIYIPISILWTIQINWLQWTLVIIGAALSGTVLVFTFWPAVREDSKQIAIVVMAVIVIFHAALAAGFVLYFFHVPAPSQTAMNTTSAVTSKPVLSKLVKDIDGKQLTLPKLPSSAPGLAVKGKDSASNLSGPKLNLPMPQGDPANTKNNLNDQLIPGDKNPRTRAADQVNDSKTPTLNKNKRSEKLNSIRESSRNANAG